MKVCPTCQTKYSDSLEYCLQDGTVLSILPDPNATLRLESRPTHTTIANPKRGLTFGLIALAGVGMLLFLVVVVGVVAYVAWPGRDATSANRSASPPDATTNKQEQSKADSGWEDGPKTIQRINDEIGASLVNGDLATLDRLIADDYVYENDQGLRLTKQQIFVFMRNGSLRYDYVSSTESSVTVNPALTNGTLNARAQSRGQFMGQPFDDNYKYRNTYEKRSSGWQLVSGYAWYR